MHKMLFGLSVLNSLYITNNLFTYSDSFLNAPLGVTTVIAVTLMYLNDSVKKDKPSLYTDCLYLRMIQNVQMHDYTELP